MKYTLMHNQKPTGDDYKSYLLQMRGVQNVEAFLNPKAEYMHSPYLLDNIKEAAETIKFHLEKGTGNNVFLQVDSDVDGYTSGAIIYNYIYSTFGKKIKWRVHQGKEHGVKVDTVPEGTTLVLIVDAGSNQYDEHMQLIEKGVQTVVIDHHEAEKVSEYAIVVNNQLSPNYPNKSLSGAGMAFKVCQVLDDLTGKKNAFADIDLVAIGLVADMMDVRELENRFLISAGLSSISNPLITSIIEKQTFSIGDTSSINPMHISFYVAPLINALVRVGSHIEKEVMFLAFIDGYQNVPSTKRGATAGSTETAVEQCIRCCTNARNRQNKAKEKALEFIDKYIEDNNLLDNKILFIPIEEGKIDKNLTGLVAGQLVTQYKKPVLLGHIRDDVVSGSGRGNDRSILKTFKAFLGEMEMFDYVEGHQNAFGFQIPKTQLDKFLEDSNSLLADTDFQENVYEVDFAVSSSALDKKMLKDITELQSVYAKGVEEPLVAVEKVIVGEGNVSIMGAQRNTIKIVSQGQVYIMFKTNEDEYNKIVSALPAQMNIVGRANKNEWAGQTTYQIIVSDYEITNSKVCYF